jgi:23S rRNA (pseudouridine1915-N3)-methyltransferase
MARRRILAVGGLKESYLRAAQAEYFKRLQPYFRLELVEVPDAHCPEHAGAALEEQTRLKEAEALRKRLLPKEYIVALDPQGRELDTQELAEFLRQRELAGEALAFLIGGSHGLAAGLRKEAKLVLSFSKLTFPHQLFRIILLEQLYRCAKINRGETYHK